MPRRRNGRGGVDGARLREIRLRHRPRLTAAKVADALGVSPQQITKYETGKVDIPASRLAELADVYQCEVTDFFKRKK